MEQTIYIKMRNRLKVSPTYEVKLGDVAQLAGDAVVVESLQDEVIYKITARDKTHVVIDVMKIIETIRQKAAPMKSNNHTSPKKIGCTFFFSYIISTRVCPEPSKLICI